MKDVKKKKKLNAKLECHFAGPHALQVSAFIYIYIYIDFNRKMLYPQYFHSKSYVVGCY